MNAIVFEHVPVAELPAERLPPDALCRRSEPGPGQQVK